MIATAATMPKPAWHQPLTMGMAGPRPPLERYVVPREIPRLRTVSTNPYVSWKISTATEAGIVRVFRDTSLSPGEQVRTAGLLLMQERVVQQAHGARREYLLSQLPNWFGTQLVLSGIAVTSMTDLRNLMQRFLAETLPDMPTPVLSLHEYCELRLKGAEQDRIAHFLTYARFDVIASAVTGAHIKQSTNSNAPGEFVIVHPAIFGLDPWNIDVTMIEMHEACHAVDRSVGSWMLRDSMLTSRVTLETFMPPIVDNAVEWFFTRQIEANAIGAQWELLQRMPAGYQIAWQRALLEQRQRLTLDDAADWLDRAATNIRRQWFEVSIQDLLRANEVKKEFVRAGLAVHGHARFPQVNAKLAFAKSAAYAFLTMQGYLLFA